MTILVLAEHNNTDIKSSTLNTISAASEIDQDIHALVTGYECEDLAKKMCKLEKVSIVDLVNKFPQYKIWLEEIYQLINSSDWMISLSEDNIYEATFI